MRVEGVGTRVRVAVRARTPELLVALGADEAHLGLLLGPTAQGEQARGRPAVAGAARRHPA